MFYLDKIKPQYSGYQELHVHTVYSLRDAANSVKDVFDAAEENGRNAISITDHGNWMALFDALKERTMREKKILQEELAALSAEQGEIDAAINAMSDFDSVRCPTDKMRPFIEKYEAAYVATAKKAIQFVPGIEMYEGEGTEGDTSRHHIIFYAKDMVGLKTLFAFCNLAQLNRYASRSGPMPRCTMETIELFFGKGAPGHGHVIVTSACMNGRIATTLLKPHRFRAQHQKMLDELESCTVIPVSMIDEAKERVEQMTERLAALSEELKAARPLAKKDVAGNLQKTKEAYEKAVAKYGDNAQESMMPTPVDERVTKAKERYDKAQAEFDAAAKCVPNLSKMESEATKLKDSIRQTKENIKGLEKQNAPAQRVQAKIDALTEEANCLGDVFAEAKALAERYEAIFGKGNFYLELQDHGIAEEFVVRGQIVRLARETGIPLTIANDVHYKNPEQKHKRDIIASLRFNTPLSETANHPGNDQLWFKPNSDMEKLFKDLPEALENPSRIAEQCNVYYSREFHLPEFVDTKGGLSPAKYLKKVAETNVLRCYPDCKSWDAERQKAFKDRLKYELGVIEKMGYSSYLSIVEDFISWTRATYSPEAVGPGRGSGAGSLVCYLTGITNIDPLKYDLIFERFLNPDRVSMPDIDTDFAPSVRDGVVQYTASKYAYKGEFWAETIRKTKVTTPHDDHSLNDTVCVITTLGTNAARGAIRAVGRVTGVPIFLCDRIAKLVPNVPKMTIKKAIEDTPLLAQAIEQDEKVKQLIEDALVVEGMPTQTGVHAAGVIIADKPISEYAPLFWSDEKNMWAIQYDMVACEENLGLLKMDFLGLNNLDIILRAKKFIKSSKKVEVDTEKVLRADDPEVIKTIYATGDTDGIFQFESGGMKSTLQSFVPKSIEDVIMLNAAYRPGPLQWIPDITDVRHERKEPSYIVPEMEPILAPTYGYPVYQEQIQRIFHEVAGFSLGQADIIRRAMSKKKHKELVKAKDGFVKGFKSKGAEGADIETFWTQLLEFANYAFNKSHAAAYSVLSYYTAWLKHYYPAEYMASLMSYKDKSKVGVYIKDCKDYGLTVLGPDINRSIVYTAPTKNGEIRIGLEGLKAVSSAAEKIVAERKKRGEFTSMTDFVVRCNIAGVNKDAIVNLIKAGACDGLYANRQEAAVNIDGWMDTCSKAAKRMASEFTKAREAGSDAPEMTEEILYDTLSGLELPIAYKSCEYDNDERLGNELDVAGYYISGHPLDKHKELFAQIVHKNISDIGTDKEADLMGRVVGFTPLNRKKDNKPMCKFTLEDLTGSIPVICFCESYARLSTQLAEGNLIKAKGRTNTESDEEGNIIYSEVILETARKLA